MAFNVALTRRQHHLQIAKSHCTSSMILFSDHRQNHDHRSSSKPWSPRPWSPWPWSRRCGSGDRKGKAEHTSTSGFELPWTTRVSCGSGDCDICILYFLELGTCVLTSTRFCNFLVSVVVSLVGIPNVYNSWVVWSENRATNNREYSRVHRFPGLISSHKLFTFFQPLTIIREAAKY